jgi:gluconate 5-dehydrogenase
MQPDSAFQLQGQTALITGGGTGLGFGMARCLASAGAKVVIVGRRLTELENAAREIGAAAFPLQGDVTDTASLPSLVEQAETLAGPISILINNAGIHLKKPAVDTTPEEFLKVLNTHVIGAHALTRAVLPGMIRRGQGNVLFIASMASLFGIPQVVAYSAAKSAFVGMVRTLATEVSTHGVRVNAIAPGWIDSEMMRKAVNSDPARRDKILGRTPMGRFGEADDIGWAAVYLSSPAAKFVTGVVLPVDGGASIGF